MNELKQSKFSTFELHVDQLEPHPNNPRKNLGDLTELTESIKKNGVLQNLTVVPITEGDEEWHHFRVLIGHRRLAAAKAAGIDTLPCRVVEDLDERAQFSAMMEENMQRNDLTIWEQAEGFQMMLDLGDTVEQIAGKTGFSESTVRHRLKIAELGEEVVRGLTEKDDESFQMTLKDFYLLEQVSDVEDRHKILNGCGSRQGLQFALSQYKRDKRTDERRQFVTEELKGLGLRKAPKEADSGRWNGTWVSVASYQLQFEDEPVIDTGKLFEAHEADELFFFESYQTIHVVAKNKDIASGEPEEEDTEEKKRDEAKGKLREIAENEDRRRRAFIRDIIDKNVDPPEDLNHLTFMNSMIQFAINEDTRLNRDNAIDFLGGKRYYAMEKEERKEYREILDDLPGALQLLLMVEGGTNSVSGCVEYDATYDEITGEEMAAWYDLLEKNIGLKVNKSQDGYRIIDGSHPLFMAPYGYEDDDWEEDDE